MKLRKMLAAVTAVAVTLSSLSLNAFATLIPLEMYYAEASVSGTEEELKNFPLQTILDNLKYSRDTTITVPVESEDNAATGTDEASADNSTGEAQESQSGQKTELDNSINDGEVRTTTSSDKIDGEQETITITYKKGDPVVLPADAKTVWVNGDEYSLVNNTSTVNIYYASTFYLIVGSGKQLDPDNVIYKVSLDIDKVVAKPVYEVKYYTLDSEGNKEYIDLKSQNSSGSSYHYVYSYADRRFHIGDKVYVEISGKLVRSDNQKEIPADVEVKYYGYSSSDEPNLFTVYSGNSSIYMSAKVTFTYTSSGVEKTMSGSVSTHLYGYMVSFSGSFTESIYDTYSIRTNITSDDVMDQEHKYKLYSQYPANGEYTYYVSSLTYPDQIDISSSVKKAVVGRFDTLEAASEAEDISSDLFSSSKGYKADYSNGVDFTIFVDGSVGPGIVEADGDTVPDYVIHIKVTTVASDDSDDSDDDDNDDSDDNVFVDLTNSYFHLYGISGLYGKYITVDKKLTQTSRYSNYLDSYYKYNYQTAIIYDENNEYDLSKTKLNISSTKNVDVYNAVTGQKVDLSKETQDFTNGTIQYSVAATAGTGNYTVCVVKNTTGGANLFVNGPSEREIFFDDAYGMYHDILVANLGDAELTGLNVELTDAKNVKLHEYWNVGGEKNDTLAPFDSISSSNYTLSMANLAKIRLVPDGEGEIAGKLTITADGQTPVTIDLKGHAGNPTIVTQSEMVDGVKYVPYYSIVATNNIHEWNKVTFSLLDGKLPDGVTLDSRTGVLYGMPTQTGTFTFLIRASFSHYSFLSDFQVFTINILDNTDENVYNATDADYNLITPIGSEQTAGKYDFYLASTNSDQLFVSNGTYDEFKALWINGVKMTPDVDYTSESGSTRITIKSQTLKTKLVSGQSNTIAAEFRVGGTAEVKRTSQNISITKNSGGSGSGSGSSSGSGHISSGTTSSSTSNIPAAVGSNATGWDGIKTLISGTNSGTITINMNGASLIPAEILEAIKGKNIILKAVSADASIEILGTLVKNPKNIGVEVKRLSSVPAAAADKVAGAISTTAFTVDNSGDFGFSTTLKMYFGNGYAGKIVNLFKVSGNNAECNTAAIVDKDGYASLILTSGGTYVAAVDSTSRVEGDANNDLVRNSHDASAILKHIVGIEKLDSSKLKYCDLNSDGRVNALDASLILKSVFAAK